MIISRKGQARKAETLLLGHTIALIWLPRLCQDPLPLPAFDTMIFTKKQLFCALGFPFSFWLLFLWGRGGHEITRKLILTLPVGEYTNGTVCEVEFRGILACSWHSAHFLSLLKPLPLAGTQVRKQDL